MKREDLGKRLEYQMGIWPRTGSQYDSEEIDLRYQWAAEGFWNDVIGALVTAVDTGDLADFSGDRFVADDVAAWIESQMIGDDE